MGKEIVTFESSAVLPCSSDLNSCFKIYLAILISSRTSYLSCFSVLDMACNDGHAEPQDAALKTLRLFCRNPRCRQVC